MNLDADWIALGLLPDAARYAALLLEEGQEAADRFRTTVDYDARLAAWKAAR